ncbi:MAG: peptidoglycan DD-metalloendopeptidase family protein [Pseudolabrys sp.]
MPRLKVESRPRAWPHAVVLALVGIAAAGCSDSARFESSSYNTDRPAPPQNVVSSIPATPAPGHVEAQPLPAPSQPATVPGTYGSQNLGTYRSTNQYSDVTGSLARPTTSGHWTWNGGSAVTVGYGETIETIARSHHVPASALMQTNGIRDADQIRPGQRLVIPRYLSAMPQTAAVHSSAQAAAGNAHVVKSGDTLMSVARRHGVTLAALAHANHIQPTAKLSVGDRLTIPAGGHSVAVAQATPAGQVAQPRAVLPEKTRVASAAPVQSVQVAKEEPRTTETAIKTAEPSGAMPSFRWPVRGRVIAGFGSKNGTQNDGINLAVPEGTPIKAADDGVVAYAGNELKGYGNLVLIRHSNGYVSAYAHASELMVKRGDTIKRGQVIAHAGQTGNVTSPQLHFEIRKGSTPVDPTQYLGGA